MKKLIYLALIIFKIGIIKNIYNEFSINKKN